MPSSILPVEARPGSIAFPDNYADWTPEHHNGIWGGDVRGMLCDLLQDAARDADFVRSVRLASPQHTQHMPVAAPSGESPRELAAEWGAK